MSKRYVHTCVRVLDPDTSVAFYEALGYERRGKLQFETAYNIYMGLPGDADTLELTVNIGREEPYDLGDGYNHIALTVDDLDALLGDRWPRSASSPRSRRSHPAAARRSGGSASSQDPDGYRIELIDGGEPKTLQDRSSEPTGAWSSVRGSRAGRVTALRSMSGRSELLRRFVPRFLRREMWRRLSPCGALSFAVRLKQRGR